MKKRDLGKKKHVLLVKTHSDAVIFSDEFRFSLHGTDGIFMFQGAYVKLLCEKHGKLYGEITAKQMVW